MIDQFMSSTVTRWSRFLPACQGLVDLFLACDVLHVSQHFMVVMALAHTDLLRRCFQSPEPP